MKIRKFSIRIAKKILKFSVKHKLKLAVMLASGFAISYIIAVLLSLTFPNSNTVTVETVIPSSEGLASIIYFILKHSKPKKPNKTTRKQKKVQAFKEYDVLGRYIN